MCMEVTHAIQTRYVFQLVFSPGGGECDGLCFLLDVVGELSSD